MSIPIEYRFNPLNQVYVFNLIELQVRPYIKHEGF